MSLLRFASSCLAVLVLMGGCGDGGGGPERCSVAGHWQAGEERIGGDCPRSAVLESRVVVRVLASDPESEVPPWRFYLLRGDTWSQCSGTADEGQCRLELTCEQESVTNVSEISLELDLSRTGALRGRESVRLRAVGEDGEGCRADFRLEGERISPLELPDALSSDS